MLVVTCVHTHHTQEWERSDQELELKGRAFAGIGISLSPSLREWRDTPPLVISLLWHIKQGLGTSVTEARKKTAKLGSRFHR